MLVLERVVKRAAGAVKVLVVDKGNTAGIPGEKGGCGCC